MQGEGETGAALVESPEVNKVSFTGSIPTGKRIMQVPGVLSKLRILVGDELVSVPNCVMSGSKKAKVMKSERSKSD